MANKVKVQTFPVRVDKIDTNITEADLYNGFKKYGDIFSVKIMPHKDLLATTYGFVNFADRGDSEVAAMKMNGQKLNGCTLKTLLDADKTKLITDYRAYTDCKFMSSPEGCKPKEGMPCPYRHKISVSQVICANWKIKNCLVTACSDLHPAYQEEKQQQQPQVQTPTSPVIPQSTDLLTKKLEEICECAICMELMIDPKMLRCQHSFCKECLEDLIDFTNVFTIQCPSCRKVHWFKDGDTIFSLEANRQLKGNLDLLRENSSSENKSGELCQEKNCMKNANIYCVTCKKFCCDHCKNDHSLYNICDKIYPVKYSHREECMLPYCNQHNCLAKLICEQCLVFLCVYCSTLDQTHRGHRVAPVKSFAGVNKKNVDNCLDYLKKSEDFCQSFKVRRKVTARDAKNETIRLAKTVADWKKVLLANFLNILDNTENHIMEAFNARKKDILDFQSSVSSNLDVALQNLIVQKDFYELQKVSNFKTIVHAEETKTHMEKLCRSFEDITSIGNSEARFTINVMKNDIPIDKLHQLVISSFGGIEVSHFSGEKEKLELSTNVDTCIESLSTDVDINSYICKVMKDMKIIGESTDSNDNTGTQKDNISKKRKEKKKSKATKTDVAVHESINETTVHIQRSKDTVIPGAEKEYTKQNAQAPLHTSKVNLIDLDPDMIRSLLDQAPKTEAAEQSYFTNKLIELDDDEKDTDIDHGAFDDNTTFISSTGTDDENRRGSFQSRGRSRGRVHNRGRGRAKMRGNQFNQRGQANPHLPAQQNVMPPQRGYRGGSRGGNRGRHGSQSTSTGFLGITYPSRPGYTAINQQIKPVAYQRPSSASSMPSLMGLNLEQRREDIVCYNCNKSGHSVKDCLFYR